ncbi:6-phospho-3-hexuloisomerase [Prosthecomicrobium hirschii]|uniref:6-phospho-3-hexuloisomerase n=1 Tax=Prosthecodimorpha hirschii TaxID=665126 RepID=UPI00112BA103|nr:6-phospho-3-hexuloisomerase [Prosthecomicrobium hirschii]TPQ51452.1 6-phospho-3-hexuloisomerase [Prosthecomicrobium hirschii]
MTGLAALEAILSEQHRVFEAVDAAGFDALATRMAAARRVFLYGVGRNGLVLQAAAMRLAHLGIDAHFVGQLSAPPAGPGDLVLVAAALGSLPTADAVIAAARRAGAAIAVVTARPGAVPESDLILCLPAQTMADAPVSPLPLGSAFELALHLLCEMLLLDLAARLGRSHADLAARHANLL